MGHGQVKPMYVMFVITVCANVMAMLWCTWASRKAAQSAQTLGSVVLRSFQTEISRDRMEQLVQDLTSNDSHRALAILLKRLGGKTDITEEEIVDLPKAGLLVATPNRIEGSVTIEYRPPVGMDI